MTAKNTNRGKEAGTKNTERDFKSLFGKKLTETHLLYDVGRTIASELEAPDLIKKIIASIGKAIAFENASVYLVKKDMTGLESLYLSCSSLPDDTQVTIYFDNGAPGHIAESGEPLFLEDALSYEGFLHYPEETAKRGCYIGIPLQTESRILGVMGFSHHTPFAFKVEDFDLLRTLSHIISAGIEKAELFRKIVELARIDELTGMLNYRVLLEKLEEEVNRQIRTGRDFSFIMIDIDDFKRINDRYGHLEGSRLIAQMGPLLKAACRATSTDACFRYGGEEFSILLGETDIQEAYAVAERVRRSVEEYPFSVKVAHPSEQVTISLGVSTVGHGSRKSVSQVMNEADMALYRSKADGKNKVTCFSQEIMTESRYRMQP